VGKRQRHPWRGSHKELEKVPRKVKEIGISNTIFEILLKYTMRNSKLSCHPSEKVSPVFGLDSVRSSLKSEMGAGNSSL